MSLLRLAQVGTVKALPWLQKGAKALGNPLVRGGLGFGLGATTAEGGLGSKLMGGITGGALGAMPLPGSNWAMAKSAGALSGLGMTPHLAQNIAQIGVPLAGIGLFSRQGSGSPAGATVGGAQNVAGYGGGYLAQNMQNQPNVTGQYIGQGGPVPVLGGMHGQMVQGPGGTIWQQIDPTGWRAGTRYGSGLDTQQQISNQNRWFESRFPQSEMVKKADFERELAAKQLGENIEMARKMQEASQANVLNIGEQAGRDMGQLLNQRYQYF